MAKHSLFHKSKICDFCAAEIIRVHPSRLYYPCAKKISPPLTPKHIVPISQNHQRNDY